jgi:tryptophan 2,3-dioxygenase
MEMEANPVALTYGSYLKVDELLALQVPQSDGPEGPEHDEMLFIVIHQVYELWFKLVLHELERIQRALEAGETPTALATFKRVLTIFKTLVAQVDVLETMTPVSFFSFRDRLDSASGFQSWQFRQVEFLLGARNRKLAGHYADVAPDLAGYLTRPSLYDSFLRYLVHKGYPVPKEALERDVAEPPGENKEIQRLLIDIYHHDNETREVCERMVDLDEGLQEWRYRHVKMVERTIGTRIGTGGSSGAEYLRSTLFRALFPDLWAIRPDL